MEITQLRTAQFRNLLPQSVTFQARVVLIIGKNGQGKTNLLEAIYLLSQARSFRKTKPRDLVCWGKGGCEIAGTVLGKDGTREICFRVQNGRSAVFINDKQVVQASLFYGQLMAVLFSPEDLQLIRGLPELRRQFIDRTLAMVDRGFVEHLVQYERALKSRNITLRSFLAKRGQPRRAFDAERLNKELEAELHVWDQVLIEHGVEIAKKRQYFIDRAQAVFSRYYQVLTGAGAEGVAERRSAGLEHAALQYHCAYCEADQLLPPTRLAQLYAVSRLKDLHYSSTTFGVHRDDVAILLDTGSGEEHSARKSASQGQARSLVLALKLSARDFLEAQSGEAPLLLLDDVESELDLARKGALYELLSRTQSQVILSANAVSAEFKKHFEGSEIKLVSEGGVRALEQESIAVITQ